MAILTANTATTVTLEAGQKLGIKDASGVYAVGPAVGSSAPTTNELLDPQGTWIGPVSVATTVTIRPTTAGLTVVYGAEDGFNRQPVTYDQTTGRLYAGPSLVSGGGRSRSLTPLFDIFDQQISTPRRALTLPNPYSAVGPDVVHPGVLYVPTRWNGYRFWVAYTPYPNADSQYENPCVACSDDGEVWVTPQGGTNPLTAKPSNGYNADTHLVLSPDGITLYLVYRERLASAPTGNNVRVMESADGRNWSAPRTVLSGAYPTQDYASPSVFWDVTNSRWVMISHNLDGGATYPMQRNVTSGADIYSGWSAPSAVSITNPTAGRTFWHSSFDRLPDGRVVGLVQDIANAGAGAPGALFAAESLDGGLTFAVRLIYADLGFYRCSMSLMDGVGGLAGMHAWIGRQAGTFSIHREDWLPGADQRAIDQAFQEYAAYGSWRPSVLWFDNFNRADGAVGAPVVGGALTVDTGTYTISSNTLRTGSAGGNRALGTLATGDYLFEATCTAAVGQWWLIFRAVDTSNYWRIGAAAAGAATFTVQNIVAGGINSTATVTGPLPNNVVSPGDRIRVVCRGRRFRVYVNGRLWQEVIDNSTRYSSNVSTGVKFGVQADNAGTTFDNLLVMA